VIWGLRNPADPKLNQTERLPWHFDLAFVAAAQRCQMGHT
jgi:hypothetical protein